MSDVTAPTPAPAPSELEKLGGVVLDFIVAEAAVYKTEIVSFVEGELAAGETSAASAISKAFAAKIPVVGAALSPIITTGLATLEGDLVADVPGAYVKLVAFLSTKAKALGG